MPRIITEHFSRSFVKAISFRIIAILANIVVVFIVSGEVRLVFEIVLVTAVVNTLLYIAHERAWDKVRWGRSHG